ncbi:putative nitrate reductase [Hyaloscypha hepaticicola]|uniref:Nitrate reductase n=1 Tax=Hyaloscypha hepaticicola TaxID=2082293 RepID=A0A2J6QA57_9HELO|nr:putative nitrate reductase [Hyaloscypha hepaticicola]
MSIKAITVAEPPPTDARTKKPENELLDTSLRLPPSPPKSEANGDSIPNSRRSSSASAEARYPLPPPTNPPKDILKEDLKTPDNHVPRDPRLIRLTGIHPFNVEAPLSALYDEGFLTSPELFYVRNHGAVPQVDDANIPDWEFSIEGMVKHPIIMTLKQLIADYEQITVPITLVCAGNRRKEQNQVRKSKGFSWGAAGLSTALWTGVPIGELIKRAVPMRGAKYICMEGADKLPNGYYGTSVKLNWAMDANRGIMLAHKMNGEILRPDHGKPLRVVVPGQIGGRSVKWLKKLIITAEPSDNWYHIYDNRVLPTMISPEQSANEPKWWMDERYAIYDLSTNSATVYPAHEEQVCLANGPETYRARGYAYGGGGRRITRVEITLDKGKSWALADIRYHEDDYRDADENDTLYGGKLDMGWRETCFTWCFWEIDLKVEDLKLSGDIMVRAMDESMNVQPRDMYWSVLGMMNNPWYRIMISREGEYLRFEHPTQPALIPGGWMEKVKARGGNLANGFWGEKMGGEGEEGGIVELKKEIKMTKDGLNRSITIDELRTHDSEANPWFVVNGEVYDGTAFLEGHPGGSTSIIGAAGQDATDEFMAIHSETAKVMMQHYHIGTLDEASRAVLHNVDEIPSEASEPREVFLQSKTWTKALLSSKQKISSDTRIFNFTLEHKEQTIGLPIGQHLMMRLRDPVTREAIIRSYTPISEGTDKGFLQVLVKVYFDTKERAGGKMTKALDAIPVGNFVDFKGPIGKFEYLSRGHCTIGGKPRFIKRFIMICAGSGITPIFQVLRAVLKNPEDETKCLVLDGNRLEEDILCKEEMDAMVKGKEDSCRLLYCLTRPGARWQGLVGRISKELLEKEVGVCRAQNGEELVLICGPEALEKSVHGILNDMGWKDEDLLFF